MTLCGWAFTVTLSLGCKKNVFAVLFCENSSARTEQDELPGMGFWGEFFLNNHQVFNPSEFCEEHGADENR